MDGRTDKPTNFNSRKSFAFQELIINLDRLTDFLVVILY